jgi:hypothetical protein
MRPLFAVITAVNLSAILDSVTIAVYPIVKHFCLYESTSRENRTAKIIKTKRLDAVQKNYISHCDADFPFKT